MVKEITPINPQNTQERIELNELCLMVQDIETYNEQYSMGTMLGEGIRKSMGDKLPPRIPFKFFKDKNLSVSKKIGVGMEPIKVRNITMISSLKPEEVVNPREIRINIENAKSFNSFLSKLDNKTFKDYDVDSLIKIATSLTQQIRTEYDLESLEDDRLVNLFSGLEEIISHYKRLDSENINGLSESVKSLETYLDASRKGYMREYLLAEACNVLPRELGNDGFGPSSWQNDNTPDRYLNMYWKGRAFNTLDILKKNPSAKDLYNKVLNHLKEALGYAKINSENKIDKYKNESKEQMVGHFTGIRKKMDEVENILNTYK